MFDTLDRISLLLQGDYKPTVRFTENFHVLPEEGDSFDEGEVAIIKDMNKPDQPGERTYLITFVGGKSAYLSQVKFLVIEDNMTALVSEFITSDESNYITFLEKKTLNGTTSL